MQAKTKYAKKPLYAKTKYKKNLCKCPSYKAFFEQGHSHLMTNLMLTWKSGYFSLRKLHRMLCENDDFE